MENNGSPYDDIFIDSSGTITGIVDVGGTVYSFTSLLNQPFVRATVGPAGSNDSFTYLQGGRSGSLTAIVSEGTIFYDSPNFSFDRSAGGGWRSAVSVPSYVSHVAADAQGDLVAAGANTGTTKGRHNTVITAAYQPLGGHWGSQEVITPTNPGGLVYVSDVQMTSSGTAILSWEVKSATAPVTHVTHASIRQAGSAVWTDLGPVTSLGTMVSHGDLLATDEAGHAVMISSDGSNWYSFPVSAIALGKPDAVAPASMSVQFAGSDATGNVTLIAYDSTTQQLFAIDGNMLTNTYSAPVLISGTDAVDSSVAAINSSGQMVVGWDVQTLSGGMPSGDYLRLIERLGTGKGWSKPMTTITSTGSFSYYEKAVLDGSGGGALWIYEATVGVSTTESVQRLTL
jgi:hypothetical protein